MKRLIATIAAITITGITHPAAAESKTTTTTDQRVAQENSSCQHHGCSIAMLHDWMQRIHLSGYANIDAKAVSSGPVAIVPVFQTCESASDINVNNANVFVDVDVNRWVLAHIGIAYVADSVNLFNTGLYTAPGFVPLTKSIRSDKNGVFSSGELTADEAFVTIRNWQQSSCYLRAGKMLLPFGHSVNPYPITYSLPQLLSQTRATAIELGVVTTSGFIASAYALSGYLSAQTFANAKFDERKSDDYNYFYNKQVDDHIPMTCVNNFGLRIGYGGCYQCVTYHLNAGYLNDIRDVSYLSGLQDFVAPSYNNSRDDSDTHVSVRGRNGLGMKQTSGIALHADALYQQFVLSLDYVTATGDVIQNVGALSEEQKKVLGDIKPRCYKTQLWAADITASYHPCLAGYQTNFALSYQASRQAAGILPRWRLQCDASLEVFDDTHLTFEYAYNQDYCVGSDENFCHYLNYQSSGNPVITNQVCGGTGNSANLVALRLGVVF